MKLSLGWLALIAAMPLPAAAQSSEREQLAAERRVLSERFAAEERECRQRFAVTACVDDVRIRRRDGLTPLRDRELRLDEAERRQRAKERQAALASKQRAATQRSPAATLPEMRVRGQPAAPPGVDPAAARHSVDEPARAAEAAERARTGARRIEEAQATQAEIAKRLADRQARGKVAAPLPVPASAAGR